MAPYTKKKDCGSPEKGKLCHAYSCPFLSVDGSWRCKGNDGVVPEDPVESRTLTVIFPDSKSYMSFRERMNEIREDNMSDSGTLLKMAIF